MPGRIVRSVVVVGLVIGAVQTVRAPSSSAVAPASCATQFGPPDPALVPTPWPEDFSDSPQDIDDDGGTDLVVGVPAASADGRAGAGVVDVHYSRFPGSTATVQRVGASYFQGVPAPAVGDGFGSAVAFADINDDPQARDFCQDLVIGVPGANGGRGEVIIAFGSVGGLDPAGAVVMHGTQAGEHYGAAVVASGHDIWVGAPDRSVNGKARAGAVEHLRMEPGLVTHVENLAQGVDLVPGVSEVNDRFGQVLSAGPGGDLSLAVGQPGEDVGSLVDAGAGAVTVSSSVRRTIGRRRRSSRNIPRGSAARPRPGIGSGRQWAWGATEFRLPRPRIGRRRTR